MTTNRTPIRRASRGALSSDQEQCLWLGVGRDGFPFEDEEQAKELWTRHRERLMASHARHGHRPYAWWAFESEALGLDYPGYESEASYLYEHDQLGAGERDALVESWKVEFERCHEPDFTYCGGPGEFLKGNAARQRHLAWADVPASLVKRWTAERRAMIYEA